MGTKQTNKTIMKTIFLVSYSSYEASDHMNVSLYLAYENRRKAIRHARKLDETSNGFYEEHSHSYFFVRSFPLYEGDEQDSEFKQEEIWVPSWVSVRRREIRRNK